MDEMTIAFKGRSTLKTYNPHKPDKYGYKVFVLSEAKSGYVLEWSMYTGQNADEHAEIGASHLIVRQLMAPYTGKGHEVYMDSYYTSPAIATLGCVGLSAVRGEACQRPCDLPCCP